MFLKERDSKLAEIEAYRENGLNAIEIQRLEAIILRQSVYKTIYNSWIVSMIDKKKSTTTDQHVFGFSFTIMPRERLLQLIPLQHTIYDIGHDLNLWIWNEEKKMI